MKKISRITFSVVVIFGLLLTTSLSVAIAAPENVNGVSAGSWTGGTEVKINLTGTAFPSWLQLMDETGVTVASKPGQICHPFRGGNYGWVADIRQLVSGSWKKVATTMAWLPSEEGVFTACAQAPAAGTYALFGYWDKSKGPASVSSDLGEAVCQYSNWVAYFWYHDDSYEWDPGYSLEIYLGDNVEEFPLGQEVTYEITGTYPIPDFDFPQTGSTTSWDDGAIYATFTDTIVQDWPDFTNTLLVKTGGCTYALPWDSADTYCSVFDDCN